MGARRDAVALLAGGGLADLAYRAAQVALPLVVLAETGSVMATGLAAGATAVPVMLSPWWARRARQWIDSGRRLAVVSLAVVAALATIPAAAVLDLLGPVTLAASGLLLGLGEALSKPARSALVADAGDRLGPASAVVLMTWQDLLDRVGIVVGPPIAALAVAADLTVELLWTQVAATLVSAALATSVHSSSKGKEWEGAPSIRTVLASRPDVVRGWMVRGTGCATWFAFTLGLSVIGAERGQPGVYLAAGMSGYGIGAIVGSTVTVALVRRLPAVPTMCLAWTVVGVCWAAIGIWTGVPTAGVAGAIAGAVVPAGNAAISAVIVRSSNGADRRTLLSGQGTVVSANYAAGMLIGGPLIAVVGAGNTLVAAGVVTTVVALVVLGSQARGDSVRVSVPASASRRAGAPSGTARLTS